MRKIAFVIWIGTAFALDKPPEPAHRPLELRSPLQDKNFYLLSLLERIAAARDAVKANPDLARITAGRLASIGHAVQSCKIDLDCNTGAFRWSDEQIAEAGRALAALYGTSPAVRELTDGPLRTSGMYVRSQELEGGALLEHAFGECMRAIDRAIDVYGLGKPPRYAAIDSMTYDAKTDGWRRVVQNLAAVLDDDPAGLDLPFSASLRFALELMQMNQRDEAGRFEPMDLGENSAALRRIPTIDWNRYAYTAIVIPGAGNDRPGVRLSPGGRLRDDIGAKRYRDGKAPFILVSGGFVHPNQTEFAEAIEMKHDLMTRLGIPEGAIIVDPHARHTTTNMRNAARLLYRYGIPFNRKALVSTDPAQSQYIEGQPFAKRCMDELGYMPYRLAGRTSAFDLEFLPTIESLQADGLELLDP